MRSVTDHLVTSSSHETPLEALRLGPGVLLGVSPAALASLATLDIHTVFDLASSRVFANAALLVSAATDPTNVLARFGLAPEQRTSRRTDSASRSSTSSARRPCPIRRALPPRCRRSQTGTCSAT